MQTPGEEIVGEYLRNLRGCDFIQYNLQTTQTQGEIDVIGINMAERHLYVCEVAIHLSTGLQYTKNKRPDNVDRFVAKFTKDIQYARMAFPDYEHTFMLWSPIVKTSKNPVYNQMVHIADINKKIHVDFGVELQLIVNQDFQDCMSELRRFAGTQTAAFTSPIMRMLQIEERLAKHLKKTLPN
ncbi:hypothetical protein [Algisphaera agarilytica]|uniref:Uncharacterized protein n=1 Tax=Algisphaera agarilytica TaxID=1385975 RepID=A0A7X0H8T0_9BACT|nr:hypothetical protein [Algisphaera agarilytica]MBB6431390.1 hypothetical protein [Algisphaera agarilytica]